MDRDIAELVSQEWDVLVIGAGLAGATIGYKLARLGRRVLFCEKGLAKPDGTPRYVGDYAETSFPDVQAPALRHAACLRKAGRCWDEWVDVSGERERTFIPFIGAGGGGSSALYGMAMERLFPSDFTPRRNFAEAAESTLPESWPITYEDLAPFYDEAEALYRVRGSRDPLRHESALGPLLVPAALSPAGRQLWSVLEQEGLHPYRLPMACEHVSNCQGCQGYLCPRDCKNDGGRTCLTPAITRYGAALLDECEVERLEATEDRIIAVECHRRGQRFRLRAKRYVLAAGALATPCILLRSRSDQWPAGLANRSGLVGRNLMRHFVDLYLIKPRLPGTLENRHKEIAFSDFYETDRGKLGSVQSFGRLPPADVLIASLEKDAYDKGRKWLVPLVHLAGRIARPIVRAMVNNSVVLAAVTEDLPYHRNRVFLDASGRPILDYRISPHDAKRIETMRAYLRAILRHHGGRLIRQAENNERIAHACGTCRFGKDPRESALDPYNRAHGLANLYVVDSSFFPSSGGVNPALTIVANALRVATHLSNATS